MNFLKIFLHIYINIYDVGTYFFTRLLCKNSTTKKFYEIIQNTKIFIPVIKPYCDVNISEIKDHSDINIVTYMKMMKKYNTGP